MRREEGSDGIGGVVHDKVPRYPEAEDPGRPNFSDTRLIISDYYIDVLNA